MADRSNQMMGGVCFESICIFLLGLCLTMVSCGGQMKPCSPYTKPHKAGVCGSKIDEALEILCGEGGFVERKYRKRSVSRIEPDILDLDAKTFLALHKQQNAQLDNKQPIVDILLPESKASSFLDKRVSFYRKGISCECCYHSCTVGELASYCKNPGKSSLRWFNI
ncbi:molluscan insulin-related peptide 3-like [Ruditapes philippinarum]|uniref:molluscan insulin-related peptide 3-like n=1 Tax=Ruditapes philippinarum TaxID=129788 RepID=UPI00295B7635|nr:molluscan insulin-related peptide 3-like [Ruditapes philippinarum]